jgi:hypothetical protein
MARPNTKSARNNIAAEVSMTHTGSANAFSERAENLRSRLPWLQGLVDRIKGLVAACDQPFAILDAAHWRLPLKPCFQQHRCSGHVSLYLFYLI